MVRKSNKTFLLILTKADLNFTVKILPKTHVAPTYTRGGNTSKEFGYISGRVNLVFFCAYFRGITKNKVNKVLGGKKCNVGNSKNVVIAWKI